jgi:Clostripain family
MATKKRWTVMVYLAGDNNLDGAGVVDLKEMKQVGSNDQVNIVAQFDRAGVKTQTIRYCLRKKTPLAKDAVKRLGETNMGDPKVLQDFVSWSVNNYPAEHYMLVLWNHGAGWDDANLYQGDVFGGAAPPVTRKRQTLGLTRGGGRVLRSAHVRAGISHTRRALFRTTVAQAVRSRAIAFDDQAQDFLDNIELKRVLLGIKKMLKRKIDILGMDACLMSMLEVAYQIKDTAAYQVGSEESEPGEGWPYDRILKLLAAKPSMSPGELAADVVNQYLASYGSDEDVTQSALNLAALDPLAQAVDGLATALKGALGDSAARTGIMTARAQVQEYSRPYDDYCDLLDLCELLAQGVHEPMVGQACLAVKQAAAQALVASGFKGSKVSHSKGISIYFPKRKLSPLYGSLDFIKKTSWSRFLQAYLAGIGR